MTIFLSLELNRLFFIKTRKLNNTMSNELMKEGRERERERWGRVQINIRILRMVEDMNNHFVPAWDRRV